MKDLKHKHIVKYLGNAEVVGDEALVMKEYTPNLGKLFQERQKSLDEGGDSPHCRADHGGGGIHAQGESDPQVLQAREVQRKKCSRCMCHNNACCEPPSRPGRDLKPGNILFKKSDDSPWDRANILALKVKVADMGLSRHVPGDGRASLTAKAGTPSYWAPEVEKGGRSTTGARPTSIPSGLSPL